VPRFPSYVGVRIDVKPVANAGAHAKANAGVNAAANAPPPAKAKKGAVSTGREAAVASSSGAAGTPRYFEFVGGNSSKFWEVSQSGKDMTTRWGRIGTDGQSKTKTFADEAAAAKQVAKLIEEKTGEGYVEKSG
jgi:DNA ligase-1